MAEGSAESRKALLREAAFGALIQHRNVVSTVDICTAPQDVPALLLLAFCSEGLLEAHGEEATADSMSVSRLTYCAQVLQSPQYISTRRIVHEIPMFSKACFYLPCVSTCKCVAPAAADVWGAAPWAAQAWVGRPSEPCTVHLQKCG